MYESSYNGSDWQGSSSYRGHGRSKRHGRYRRSGVQPWLVITLVVVLAVLTVVALLLGMKGCTTEANIEGRWDLDGTTVYEFYPEGKGALVLSTMSFEFTYTVEGNQVSIDFADERATDAQYEFAISDDLLMLTGGPGEGKAQHILKRDNG